MYYDIKRNATAEEIKIFLTVEAYVKTLTESEADSFTEKVSNYAWAYKADERRRAYNALYRTARKIGITVADLETWYFIEKE